jgi:tRNA modification GTPase
MGIERSLSAIKKSDHVFYVLDLMDDDVERDLSAFSDELRPDTFFVFNKVDLDPSGFKRSGIEKKVQELGLTNQVFWVSATSSSGLKDIENFIGSLVQHLGSEASNVVTQARHLELLQKIHSCLTSGVKLMRNDESPEFIAFEMQEAIRAIHELLGKEFDEQVIDRVFKEFCLGK